jgi:ubiquinone/menaquinone biosynthesis C-methylase UbiE
MTVMSPITWDNLYTDHADVYELLVSHEDYQDHLIQAIKNIQPLTGTVAAEFGCGTGRVSGLLAGRVRRLHAFDLTRSMLRMAQNKRNRLGWDHVSFVQADSREMPVRAAWADFAIEGWAFLHIAVNHPANWQFQLGRALDEMRRVVPPGGKLILIETLGTGQTEPNPAAKYREVYDWLEREQGFCPKAIRTDFLFEAMQQVQEVVIPLFGEKMLDVLIPSDAGIIVPECTGLWWRTA